MNIISKQLINIAKLISSSITVHHDIENYIWNKIKKNSTDKYYSITYFNTKEIQQLLEIRTNNTLTICIANYNIFWNEYQNNKKINIPRNIKNKIYESIQYSEGFTDLINDEQFLIVVFYDEQLYNQIKHNDNLKNCNYIDNNITTISENFNNVKNIFKHQLIHFYKMINQLDPYKIVQDAYYCSKQEYDSWLNDLKYQLIKNITNVQIQNDKIYKVEINNKFIDLKTFITTYIKSKQIDKRFYEFINCLKQNEINDLINETEKTLLYQYNNKTIYNNIEQAFNNIQKNYFSLYKAINKNLITDKNKIYKVVQQLIAHNKIYLVTDLIKNNKINKNDKQFLTILNKFNDNQIVCKNLVYNDLIVPNADFVIKYISNINYLYEYIEQQQYNLNTQQLIKLIDKYSKNADYDDLLNLVNNIENKNVVNHYINKISLYKTINNYNVYKKGLIFDSNRQLNKQYNIQATQTDVQFYITKYNKPYCAILEYGSIQLCNNNSSNNLQKLLFHKQNNKIFLQINNQILPPNDLKCNYNKQNNTIIFHNIFHKTRKAIYYLNNHYCELFINNKLFTDNKQDDIGTNLFTYSQLLQNNSNTTYFKTIDDYIKQQIQYNQRIQQQYSQIKKLLTQLYCK